MKINNDIMQLLNNNLVENTSTIKPIEKLNTNSNYTSIENPSQKDNRIMYLIDEITEGIYKIFKQGDSNDKDSFHSVTAIKEYYREEIKELDRLLTMDDITIKYGNNIGIYFRNKKIGYLSMGNKKLVENKHSCFLVWSIIGKISCNCKTPNCTKFCYNGCRETKGVLSTKIHNLILSFLGIFEPLMEKIISNHENCKNKKVYVRIHEDGDFYNTEYFFKWRRIAKDLDDKNIKFMAYTKEDFILKNYNKFVMDNFVLRYSIVDDTSKENIEYATKNGVPTYIVLGEKKVIYGAFNPNNEKHIEYMSFKNKIANRKDGCCGSCEYCKKCYNNAVQNIFTVIH